MLQYFHYQNPFKTNKIDFFLKQRFRMHSSQTHRYTYNNNNTYMCLMCPMSLEFLFCSGKRKKGGRLCRWGQSHCYSRVMWQHLCLAPKKARVGVDMAEMTRNVKQSSSGHAGLQAHSTPQILTIHTQPLWRLPLGCHFDSYIKDVNIPVCFMQTLRHIIRAICEQATSKPNAHVWHLAVLPSPRSNLLLSKLCPF